MNEECLYVKVENNNDLIKCKMILDFYNRRPYAISYHKYPYYLLVSKYYYTDVKNSSSSNNVLTTEQFINKY